MNLHETNQYQDELFPVGMYQVDRQKCIPQGRGYQDLHWHEELQITLVEKGDVTMQVNGKDYFLHAGEALFINKGALHVSLDMSEDGKYTSFNFPEKLLSFFTHSRMEEKYVKTYTNAFGIRAVVIHNETDQEKEIIDDLYQLKRMITCQNGAYYEYDVSLLIVKIWRSLIEMPQMHVSHTCEKEKRIQERVQLMLTYIHQHYSQTISLEDIASAGMVSEAECNRNFHAFLKMTPYQYLLNYRLMKSEELLLDSSLNVTEIAQAVGFCSVSHYISVFKKKYHMSPKRYVKEVLCLKGMDTLKE